MARTVCFGGVRSGGRSAPFLQLGHGTDALLLVSWIDWLVTIFPPGQLKQDLCLRAWTGCCRQVFAERCVTRRTLGFLSLSVGECRQWGCFIGGVSWFLFETKRHASRVLGTVTGWSRALETKANEGGFSWVAYRSVSAVAEQVINAQKLGERACVGVALLGGEHRISEPSEPSRQQLLEQGLCQSSSVWKPIRRLDDGAGFMSSRMVSKTTLNCPSHFRSMAATFRASSSWFNINRLNRTKVRMMATFTRTARSDHCDRHYRDPRS